MECRRSFSATAELLVITLYVGLYKEYRKAYDFANIKPCDNKDKIIYCLTVKFADSIVSDMNVVK